MRAQDEAKGGGSVRKVGRPGGQGGLQEVESWGGSFPLEGSPEGTAGATKEREEEGGKCRPSKPGEEECKARICAHPRGAIVKGGQGFGLKRNGPILGCFKEGDAGQAPPSRGSYSLRGGAI